MAKQTAHKSKISGKWIFLAVVLLSYAFAALIDFTLVKDSLSLFGKVALNIIPILFVVFLLMVVINLVLTPKRIQNYLGKASGLKGWLLALLGGVLATGPIYTWYVLLGDLKKQGMHSSLAAAFLYSRAIKLPLLPLLVHYFGVNYTLILTMYLLGFSLISGIITGLLAGGTSSSQQTN